MEDREKQAPVQFDAAALGAVAWRWKWVLIGIFFIAAISAYVISKVLPPLFESHAILLPSGSNSREKQLEEFSYGYEVHSERLMQLLGSETIIDSLEQHFGLSNVWDIDKSEPQWHNELAKQSRERIRFHKTQYASVVISVVDESPERAADIANYAAHLVNVVNANIVKANATEVLRSVEKEYHNRQTALEGIHDSIGNIQSSNSLSAIERLETDLLQTERRMSTLRDSINQIRKRHNIFDYGYQVNVLNEQLAEARSLLLQETGALEIFEAKKIDEATDTLVIRARARQRGAQQRVDFFEKQLRELSNVNGVYSVLLYRMEIESEHFTHTQSELDKLRQSIEPKVTSRGLSRLEHELDFDLLRIEELEEKYQNALSNYIDPVPVAYLVSPASPSYDKIYPKTMLNIALACLGSLFLALVLIVIIESQRGKAKP